MNESDRFRSKVECKWMIDLAFKLKINNEYNSHFPYSIDNEIKKFTSVYTPEVIQKEKECVVSIKSNYCTNFIKQTSNKLYNELYTLKSLIPANNSNSSEKLAIVGENIFKKPKYCYRGIVPSIYVSTQNNNENDSDIIAVRINDFIVKSISKSSKFKTFKINTKSKPIMTVNVNKELWDEIIIENCGQISIQYKWTKDEYTITKYDSIFKEQPMGCFYFDTRTNILGPGQVKRLKVLFKPKIIGPYREIWFVQVEILGRLDPIAKIKLPLQGCAVPNVSMSKTEVCHAYI